ncbi:uncharacterized protein LOC122806568 [Protopterus annectens]|uniref:uncharacterized protein LOC122806568 n=1 Tax=Protopterus annectens TaxID=7888 RepID=UPI001CFA1414|nr:uncharacterized protein LOC122806568 [Protopterus annectens]
MAPIWWWWARGPNGLLLLLVVWNLLSSPGSCNEGSHAASECHCLKPKEPVTDEKINTFTLNYKSHIECRNNQIMFILKEKGQGKEKRICGLKWHEWVNKLITSVKMSTSEVPGDVTAKGAEKLTTVHAPALTKTSFTTGKMQEVSTSEFPGNATAKGAEKLTTVHAPALTKTSFTPGKVQEGNTLLSNQPVTTKPDGNILTSGSTVSEEKLHSSTDPRYLKHDGSVTSTGPDIPSNSKNVAVLSLLAAVLVLVAVIVVLVQRHRKGGSKKQNRVESASNSEMENLQPHDRTPKSASEA